MFCDDNDDNDDDDNDDDDDATACTGDRRRTGAVIRGVDERRGIGWRVLWVKLRCLLAAPDAGSSNLFC